MRIWSKDLIKVLPNKQLKAMRYELGDMIKQYPNIKHPLVKFANNYDSMYLLDYFMNVVLELNERKIKMVDLYNIGVHATAVKKSENKDLKLTNLRFKEDNKAYLEICYMNLFEKNLRKMISDEDFEKIYKVVAEKMEW